MKTGDVVRYLNDKACTGVITEVGSNLYLVKWDHNGVEEWMPEYALELINESR